MGWDSVSWDVTGHVSRHNSDNDKRDDALWEELIHRFGMICREHRYEPLALSWSEPDPEDA
jgi:hypothetical protein